MSMSPRDSDEHGSSDEPCPLPRIPARTPDGDQAEPYILTKVLGQGAFGTVYAARDAMTGELVALKVVHANDDDDSLNEAEAEINMAKSLRHRDNVVHMVESFTAGNTVYIVYELLSKNNLQQFIAMLENDEEMWRYGGEVAHTMASLNTCEELRSYKDYTARTVSRSILLGLVSLGRANVIHCDLKPENIQMEREGQLGLKIIDFGLSCFENAGLRVPTIDFVGGTLGYCAPEVVLGAGYGPEVDMWAFGCIVAELVTGKPLFPAWEEEDWDKAEAEQVMDWISLLGPPPGDMINRARRLPRLVELMRVPHKGTTWWDVLGDRWDDALVEFLKGCLAWDPSARLTPAEALNHPWIANISTTDWPWINKRQSQCGDAFGDANKRFRREEGSTPVPQQVLPVVRVPAEVAPPVQSQPVTIPGKDSCLPQGVQQDEAEMVSGWDEEDATEQTSWLSLSGCFCLAWWRLCFTPAGNCNSEQTYVGTDRG